MVELPQKPSTFQFDTVPCSAGVTNPHGVKVLLTQGGVIQVLGTPLYLPGTPLLLLTSTGAIAVGSLHLGYCPRP